MENLQFCLVIRERSDLIVLYCKLEWDCLITVGLHRLSGGDNCLFGP